MKMKDTSISTTIRVCIISMALLLLSLAITSTPNSVVKGTVTVTMELKAGWNLKGMPESISASDLAEKSNHITSIVHRTSDGYYVTYIPSLGITDFTCEVNEGVYIYSEVDTIIIFTISPSTGYNGGNLTVTGDLDITGDSIFDKNLTVKGSMLILGNFTVDNLNVTEDLTVYGNLTSNEDLVVGKNLTVIENLMVGKDLTVGNLTITEDMTINDDLTVTGDATIGGDSTVAGDMIVIGNLTAGDFTVGNLTIAEDLVINGNLSVVEDMAINGNLTVMKNLTVGGDIAVTGDMTVGDDLTVIGDITTNGDLSITGDAVIGGNLTAGNFTVSNLTIAKDLTINGELRVDEDIIGSGDLLVKGDATIGGNLTAGDFTIGNLTIKDDLAIDGNLSVTGDTMIGGDAIIVGSLTAGDFTVGSLAVTNDISIDGDFTITESLTIGGDLFVTGNITGVTGRTATCIIAANNSSALGKAQADYICDGVDDQVEIQAAIDALPPGGGKILLLEGTYNLVPNTPSDYAPGLYNTSVKLVPNLTIEGMGESTLLKFPDSFTSYKMMFEIHSGDENIVIEKLHFDLNCRNSPTSTMVSAIHIRSWIGATRGDIVIKDNHFHDGRWSISGDGSSGLYNYNVVVVNNLFTSDDANGNHYGINLHNFGTHSIVSGNTLHEVHTGIFLDSQERAIVSNNIIIDAKNRGIYLFDAANDNLIESNLISGAPTGIKIDITAGKRSNDRNLIIGNQIRDCDTGILVNGAKDTVILDNYLYGVTVPINNTLGVNSVIQGNMGYVTENGGFEFNVTDGAWVSHGLASTPTIVILTPRGNATAWVMARTATQFQIGVSDVVTVDWYAFFKP